MPEFKLDSYLEHSKKVDVSDMDFSQAPRYPLSEEEISICGLAPPSAARSV